MTTFDDPAFVAAFRDTTLPTSAFHHRDHVRMAWLYVREHGPMDAAPRFATDLQAFARATGVPGLYHATITYQGSKLFSVPDLQVDKTLLQQ